MLTRCHATLVYHSGGYVNIMRSVDELTEQLKSKGFSEQLWQEIDTLFENRPQYVAALCLLCSALQVRSNPSLEQRANSYVADMNLAINRKMILLYELAKFSNRFHGAICEALRDGMRDPSFASAFVLVRPYIQSERLESLGNDWLSAHNHHPNAHLVKQALRIGAEE